MQKNKDIPWWKKAVFYQVYPRSFQDCIGANGIGDLAGIINNLEYIKDLGIDGVWISPFFKSPMYDFGYDVSDYYEVDPLFGNKEIFKELLEKAHRLELKIIVDIILSHTSFDHPWFQESFKGGDNNPKKDWYVWADPEPDGSPPNNWQSIFGGTAWRYETRREQYYFHNFLRQMPDLNYHNPEVQEAALEILKYWLDFGVDGFRLDVLNFCFHDKELRDNPPKEMFSAASQFGGKEPYNMQYHIYDKSQPEMIDFLKRIRKLMDKYPDKVTLAEIGDDNSIQLTKEYCHGTEKMNTAYSFALMTGDHNSMTSSLFKNALAPSLEKEADGSDTFWPSWAFSNHDVIRVATRWGGEFLDEYPKQFPKMLIALLTTLRGTPFIYQGEELGLTEAEIPYEKLHDPWGKYLYPEWQGRDGCRTPMPWKSEKPNAGFSGSKETWLPVPEDHIQKSVDLQEKEADSVLNFTKNFLNWRKNQQALTSGYMEFLETGDDILVYKRDDVLCCFNLRVKSSSIAIDLDLEPTNFKNMGSHFKDGRLNFDPFGFGFFNIKK